MGYKLFHSTNLSQLTNYFCHTFQFTNTTQCAGYIRNISFALFVLLTIVIWSGQGYDHPLHGQILIGDVQGSSLGAITIDDMDMKMQNIKLLKSKR